MFNLDLPGLEANRPWFFFFGTKYSILYQKKIQISNEFLLDYAYFAYQPKNLQNYTFDRTKTAYILNNSFPNEEVMAILRKFLFFVRAAIFKGEWA